MKRGNPIKSRHGIVVLLVVLIGLIFSCAYGWIVREQQAPAKMGVTFSIPYARYLGLDWQDAYAKMARDLEVKHVRIPVYWSAVEYAPGQFDWKDMDWLMSISERNHMTVTLAVGAKVPRWPECFIPEWAQAQDAETRNASLLDFLQEVAMRYRTSPALERWQVENEPFFPFGVCPATSSHQVAREISLVRAIDPDRPIQTTVSGEWEPWFYATLSSDVFGFSLYRTSWYGFFGFIQYPFPPWVYRLHALAGRPFVKEGVLSGRKAKRGFRVWFGWGRMEDGKKGLSEDRSKNKMAKEKGRGIWGFVWGGGGGGGRFEKEVVLSELQAEPWFPVSFRSRPIEDWYQIFNADTLHDNIAYAKRTGISEFYLWGAEWWLYMKQQGDSRLWNAAKEEFLKQR